MKITRRILERCESCKHYGGWTTMNWSDTFHEMIPLCKLNDRCAFCEKIGLWKWLKRWWRK